MLFSQVRVHSFCTVNESVLLPDVEVGRGAMLSRVLVDQGTKIPPGLSAGIDVEQDRKRFHVTEKGITLITPSMLGQNLRHLH
jgi:glucose-1-phosphate adenylyltransferase